MSSVYNIFVGERVLTNAMVTEAVGDICFYNSKLRGDTTATSKENKADCRNSAYTRYDWEKAFFEGKFTPPKELIEALAGDFCYVTAKHILGILSGGLTICMKNVRGPTTLTTCTMRSTSTALCLNLG